MWVKPKIVEQGGRKAKTRDEEGEGAQDTRDVKEKEIRGRKLWVEGSLRVVWGIGREQMPSAALKPETLQYL